MATACEADLFDLTDEVLRTTLALAEARRAHELALAAYTAARREPARPAVLPGAVSPSGTSPDSPLKKFRLRRVGTAGAGELPPHEPWHYAVPPWEDGPAVQGFPR